MDNANKNNRELSPEELKNVSGGCDDDEEEDSRFGTDYTDEFGALIYIAKRGDNLVTIAKKYDVDWRKLQLLNNFVDSWSIHPGDRITIHK